MDFDKLIISLAALDEYEIEQELSIRKKKDLKEFYQFVYPDNEFTMLDKEDLIEDLTAFLVSQKEYGIEDSMNYYDAMNDDVSSYMQEAGYTVDPIEKSAFITTALFIKNEYDYEDTFVDRIEDFGIEVEYESKEGSNYYHKYIDESAQLFEDESEIYDIKYRGTKKARKPKPSKKRLEKQNKKLQLEMNSTNYKEVLKANNLDQWLNISLVDIPLFDFLPRDQYDLRLQQEEEESKQRPNQKHKLYFFSELGYNITTQNKVDLFRDITFDIAERKLDQQHYNYFKNKMKNYCNQIYWRSKTYDTQTNTTWKVVFCPSGSGKSYLYHKKNKQKYFDIDQLLYQRLDYIFVLQKIFQYSMINDDWDLINYFWNYLVYLNRFRIKGKILLCHSVHQINYVFTNRYQLGLLSKHEGRKTASHSNYSEIRNSKFFFKSDYNMFHHIIMNYFKSCDILAKKNNFIYHSLKNVKFKNT